MTRREKMEDLKLAILADPLYKTYDTEIEWGWGRAGKIMFIGQCPAMSNNTGKRGDSEFDKFFLKLLEPLGITKKDFYFTNLIKRPVHISEVDPRDIAVSTSYLRIESEIVKPDVIIALGNDAKNWFGKLNINFYSIIHPSAIRYGSITEDVWRNRLKDILSTNKLMKKNYEV